MGAPPARGLIVQLRITDDFGTDDEFELKYALSELFEEQIENAGLGRFDGTDMGSGSMNFFFYEIASANWDASVAVVLRELRAKGLDQEALLVRSFVDDEEADEPFAVIWPPNFTGKFSLF